MNCPHCQTELPVLYYGGKCPNCGKEVPEAPNLSPPPDQRINWLIFFGFFFGPVLLTIIAVRLGPGQGDSAAWIGFLGAAVSGIVCGSMLANRLGQTDGTKIMLGILLVPLMGVVCLVMNCFGCLASAQSFNIH